MDRNRATAVTSDQSATAVEPQRAKSLRLGETSDAELVRFIERTREQTAPTVIDLQAEAELDESRARSRELAREVSEDECEALFAEHGELVDKMMTDGGLSAREEARLAYVRWQLERIEDAQIGDNLDALERLTKLHEAISEQVANFAEQVKDVSRAPRRK